MIIDKSAEVCSLCAGDGRAPRNTGMIRYERI